MVGQDALRVDMLKSSWDVEHRLPLLSGSPLLFQVLLLLHSKSWGSGTMSELKDPHQVPWPASSLLLPFYRFPPASGQRSVWIISQASGEKAGSANVLPKGLYPMSPYALDNGGPVSDRGRGHRFEWSVAVGVLEDSDCNSKDYLVPVK